MKAVKTVSLFLAMFLFCNVYTFGSTFTLVAREGQTLTVPKSLAEHSDHLKAMLGYNSVIRCEEFGYNELIVLVELLKVLDCEVKRVEKEGGAIDARVIYPSVVLLREKYNTSITIFFKIVDYFLIKRLNDLILVERQLPLLPGEKERGTLLYDEVVLEYFDFLVRSTRVPQYFDLLGRMLYPMIHKKPNFEYMFVFLRGYPEIEEVILKAYTQQHPELYPGLYKVRKIDLSSGGSYKIFFECLKQGIFIADGFSIKIYDIDRLNLVKEMESNSRDSSEDYCALSPDGRTLVKDNGKEIYLLDINNGNKLCLLTYQAKGFNAHKPLLKFSPKGNRLAASVKSGDTYFFELFDLDGKYLLKKYDSYRGVYNVAFSPDNTKFAFVACKSFDKVRDDEWNPYWNMTICLGNSDTGEITDELNYEGGKVLAFCLTQSAPIVADRHGIVSFNSDKKVVRIPFDPEIDGRAIVSGTAFSPDFNTIAMVYSRSRRCIRFYSVKTGKLSYEFPPLGTLEKEYMPVSEGYEEIIKFSPDSLYCAFVNGRINNTQARPPLLPASVWVFRSIISLTDALEVQLE